MMIPRLTIRTILVPLFLLFGSVVSHAQSLPTVSGPLTVGVKEAPPFAFQENGEWTGLSVNLWREVAADLGITFTFEERTLADLLEGLAEGELDVGVGAISITSARENVMDFSHPFYSTGLGIVVDADNAGKQNWYDVLGRFFSWGFLQAVATLAVVLLAVGFFLWLFERKRNPDMFGGGTVRGLGDGFWWSAVTMTTVGYGDKAPQTLGGRIVAVIWMFAAIIIISSFTAAITSSLTLSSLNSLVENADDLRRARVASIVDTAAGDYLRQEGVRFTSYDSPRAAMEAVAAGEVDAAVYDKPLMQYLVMTGFENEGLAVLPETFTRQDYGLALTPGSPLREQVNQILLDRIHTDDWRRRVTFYTGGEGEP